MTNSIEIPTKMIKALADALGYRKRKVIVRAAEEVTLYGLNWDGGSRNQYHAVRLDDFAVRSKSAMNVPAPWKNAYEGAKVPLIPGLAVAKTGTFCGKESVMTLYVHPSVMPQLLPAS